MKKIKTISFLILLFLFTTPFSYAKESKFVKNEIKNIIRGEKGVKEVNREENKGILDQIKNKIKNLEFSAKISGTISSIGSSDITVLANDGKTYKVYIVATTQLRRKFWGKSELSEFSKDDKVNVIGKWKNSEKTEIEAKVIRDVSIQKRHGVFFGEISSKTDNSFVLKTPKRGDQTVEVVSSTKYVNRKEEVISYKDLQIGHRVRVKGVWDSKVSKIFEVTQIKDFSIPEIKPTPTTVK